MTAPAGNGTVTAFTERLPSGWQAIYLRSATLEVTVLPEKGGEIYALTARQHTTPESPKGIDLLWKSPWGLRPPPLDPPPTPPRQPLR